MWVVGMQTGIATVENTMEVPQKVKNRNTPQSSNCATGGFFWGGGGGGGGCSCFCFCTTEFLTKDYKNTNSKGPCTLILTAELLNNSQDMEATQVTIDRGMDQEDVVYIHNGILCSHQKK